MVRSAANMTQLVDQLESRSLLRRIPSPSDRRATLLEITEEGRQTVAKVDELYVRTMQEICRDYPDEELRGAIITLRRFCFDAAKVLGIEMRDPRQHS